LGLTVISRPKFLGPGGPARPKVLESGDIISKLLGFNTPILEYGAPDKPRYLCLGMPYKKIFLKET